MPDPGEVYRLLSDFNRRLTQREKTLLLLMGRKWSALEKRLWGHIDSLLLEIAAQGLKTDGQIYRLHRYEQLIQMVQAEIAQYEAWAMQAITTEEQRVMDMGFGVAARTAYGERLMAAVIDRSAVANIIGQCQDGSPLFSVLRQRALGPEAIEGLTMALLEGVALGYNPRKTARMMANGLAQGLNKAMVIARTEQARAAREATREGYRQMGYERYQRHCAKSDRTCIACLGLDGETYPIETPFYSHPQCRCFMTPVFEGMPQPARAQAWFDGLDEDGKLKLLGPGRYELYQNGVSLRDMVRIKNDPVWGPTITIRPIRSFAD